MQKNENKNKKKISLVHKILAATVLGIIFGVVAGPVAKNVQVVGNIWMRMIQMSIVVLVMGAVIEAVGNLNLREFGKIGAKTLSWFLIFTVFSIVIGIVIGIVIQPGLGVDYIQSGTEIQVTTQTFSETILNSVPSNVVSAMSSGNMVQCIVFSIMFGLALSMYTVSSGNTIVLDFIKGFNSVILNIIKMVMGLAPIGIFALLAGTAGTMGIAIIIPMIKFLGSLALGTIIISVVIVGFTSLYCKVSPVSIIKKITRVSILALTTTSGAICLPTKMEDSVTKFGISRKISDFVGPLSMAMNSCGSAVFNGIAILTMTQLSGVEITMYQLVVLVILTILKNMGTVSVPGGSAVTLAFLATGIGIPLETIGILISVDWFSGMFRTLLNVDIDILVALIVAVSEGEFDREIYDGKKEVLYS